MKTDIANAFAEHILSEAKSLQERATMYAIDYAKSDDPNDKAMYLRYSFAAEEVRKLHGVACQAFHAIERLIPNEPIEGFPQ